MVKFKNLNVPMRHRVPGWLGFITAIAIMFPTVLINGTYTGDITEVSGTLGVLSEDIRMAYYAASVGMAVSYPLTSRIQSALTTKTNLLIGLLMQVVLSFICAWAGKIEIVIICSFFIGLFKGFAMLEIIVMMRPFFSPGNIRSEFYAYFYPIVFSAGQVSMALTAQLAYNYQWQYMYYLEVILLLVAILFVLLFFRYDNNPIRIPFREMDGRSVLLGASALLFIIYVCTYGKTLDWFSSPKIRLYAIASPVLVWFFFYRQNNSKKPYIRLEVLNCSKALVAYSFMMIAAFFSSSSTLLTSYATSIIKVDNVYANTLNLWVIPGFVCGAVVCFHWFRRQRWRFRLLISGGMFCFVIYFGILYFGIAPDDTYEMLYLPMFLRGMGMMILFIAFGVYAVEDMDPRLAIYNAFFLIAFRSALAPALSSSFYNNMLYRLQADAMNTLSENMRMDNPLASGSYLHSLNAALAQGHAMEEAAQIAANSLYAELQAQSLLSGLKTLIGYMLVASLAIAVVSRFIPFHSTSKISIVKTGGDMV